MCVSITFSAYYSAATPTSSSSSLPPPASFALRLLPAIDGAAKAPCFLPLAEEEGAKPPDEPLDALLLLPPPPPGEGAVVLLLPPPGVWTLWRERGERKGACDASVGVVERQGHHHQHWLYWHSHVFAHAPPEEERCPLHLSIPPALPCLVSSRANKSVP
jgi:hypothetical protein